MKRKRIVIKLDAPGAGAGKAPAAAGAEKPLTARDESRRGIGKPLLIIAIILVVIIGGVVGGAYFWWRHYQSSPAYTLAVLAYAAQQNDTATVDSIFDTDKVTDDLAEQVRRQQTSSIPGVISSALPSQLQPEMPVITPEIRQRAHDELVKELQRLTAPAAGKPFILLAIGIKYFADVRQENNAAQVLANVRDEHIKLTMQADAAGHWRIIAVEDDKMAKRIVDKLTPYFKTTPKPSSSKSPLKGAAPKSLPDEARKQLERLLGQSPSPSPSP